MAARVSIVHVSNGVERFPPFHALRVGYLTIKKSDINNLNNLLEFYNPVTREFEQPKHRYNRRKPVVGILCDEIQSTPP